MANRKKTSDSEVLEKAFPTISKHGFESFTLEQVSKTTRLSPAALIKRFKSKKNLAVLSRNQKWEVNIHQMLELKKSLNLTGISGIYHFVELISNSVDSDNLGEHLRQLGSDALNFKLQKKVGSYFQTTRDILKDFIDQAINDEQIKKTENPVMLSVLLEATIQGSIFQFSFMDKKNIHSHLKNNVREFLAPYLK